MTDDPASLSRRAYLRGIPAAIGAGIAGCPSSDGTASPPGTLGEPSCPEGETAAPAVYDDWFARLEPDEYAAPSVVATAVTPPPLARFERVADALEPYLYHLRRDLDRAALAFPSLDRVLYVKPPGDEHAAYLAVRKPERLAEREAWLGRLRLQTYVTTLADYRSFSRRSVRIDAVQQIAFDEEHVLVAPAASGPVELDPETRLRRLVATARGDEHPYHCYRPAARALLDRSPTADFTYARIRTDDGTFGSGAPVAPPGSRAASLTVHLRWQRRDLVVSDGASTGTRAGGRPDETATVPGSATADPLASSASTGTSATATPTRAGSTESSGTPTAAPDEPLADLRLVAAFPDDPDAEAVRDHVADRWPTAGSGRDGLAFDDPSYATDGRTVAVTETRPVAELVS